MVDFFSMHSGVDFGNGGHSPSPPPGFSDVRSGMPRGVNERDSLTMSHVCSTGRDLGSCTTPPHPGKPSPDFRPFHLSHRKQARPRKEFRNAHHEEKPTAPVSKNPGNSRRGHRTVLGASAAPTGLPVRVAGRAGTPHGDMSTTTPPSDRSPRRPHFPSASQHR